MADRVAVMIWYGLIYYQMTSSFIPADRVQRPLKFGIEQDFAYTNIFKIISEQSEN